MLTKANIVNKKFLKKIIKKKKNRKIGVLKMDIDLILNKYYQNNAKELKRIVNKMLDKYNFPQKDYDEFYSIANETMNSCIKTYDNSKNCSFDTFLWRCIENKIYSE